MSKAAERFKNLETEQTEWEEKYGNGSAGPSSPSNLNDTPSTGAVPHLDFNDPRRASSQLSLLSQKDRRYESLSLHSPTLGEMQRPGSSAGHLMEGREVMKDDQIYGVVPVSKEDDEIESKMKLLEEVRQARLSVRSSLDQLRTQRPTLSLGPRDGGMSTATTPTSDRFSEHHVRRLSAASSRMLDNSAPVQPPRPKSDWEQYTSERHIVTPSLPSPAALASDSLRPTSYRQNSMYDTPGMDRRERTTSMLETRVSDFGAIPHQRQSTHETYPTHEALRRTESAHANIAMSRPMSNYDLARPVSQYDTMPIQRSSNLSTPGMITGSAARGHEGQPRSGSMQRTMTYEELAERHRKRISKLQDPVSSKMNEEVALAQAKDKWERQKRQEKEEMRKREAEKMMRQQEREREMAEGKQVGSSGAREEALRKAEEWRRSVHTGLDSMGGAAPRPRAAESVNRGSYMGQQPGMGKRRMSSHMAN